MSPARTAVALLVALQLQLHVFGRLSLDGAHPEVLIVLVLASGFLAGPDDGAIVGFVAGLAFDVFVTTPFGLTAFVYTLAGYAIGAVTPRVERPAWWLTALAVGAGAGVTMVAYALIGAVVGLATFDGPPIATIVAVVALVGLVVAPLAALAVRWARVGDRSRRRHAYFS